MKGFETCPHCRGSGTYWRTLPQLPDWPGERVQCDVMPLPHEVGGWEVANAIFDLMVRGVCVEPAPASPTDSLGLLRFKLPGGEELSRSQLIRAAQEAKQLA